MEALSEDRRRLIQIHFSGPVQQLPNHLLVKGGIRGYHPACIENLTHKAGDAVKGRFHVRCPPKTRG
ncbi:hypothetical protein DSCA_18060 [Desulfosarcina alkanivorans]|uniref:Uncharacterized protein n=1 Tax=Desulfosarcina alkanivorans TaxID=571177 RepID=A0A5K7YFR2_9BACT|nr:hypothetical protein DSCA_18060 [Desulfosarcina alkanivorans]